MKSPEQLKTLADIGSPKAMEAFSNASAEELGALIAEQTKSQNAIFTIYPYLDRGVLAFDDAARGLSREPFVLGADSIICMAARAAGHDLEKGFPLHFSSTPIPNAAMAVKIEKPESNGGAWYLVEGYEGWLCPATLKYFDTYPEQIFFIVPNNYKQGVSNG